MSSKILINRKMKIYTIQDLTNLKVLKILELGLMSVVDTHILKNYQAKILDFKYFYNINFRGIGALKFKEVFKIDNKEIDTINSYNYFQDYSNYIISLQSFTNV